MPPKQGISMPVHRPGARRAELLTALGVAAAVVVGACLAKVFDRMFGFWGDNAESFAPLWHHLGTELRAGRWVPMDPAGWAGGNYVAEAAYGVLNPVSLANFVLLSTFDDLARGIFVVVTEFLALLGVATFLLARSYGAGRVPAVSVGVAMPLAGFTLFYGAGNWASGLMATTWVVWFWWAAHRYSRGTLNPIVAFAFGALAITVGNPYAVLGVIVVLVTLATDLAIRREWFVLGRLVVLGASVGAVGALVYLPLVGTLGVTDRQASAPVSNDGYMVPDLQDLMGMSSPSYLPSMNAWYSRSDFVPSTYLAWFVLPLLPWLRWGSVRTIAPRLVGPVVFTSIMLLLTIGPARVWLFRWPIRLVEYSYVGLSVLFAAVLTLGFATSRARLRGALSAAVIGFGFFNAWAVNPQDWTVHLGFALLVLVLCITVLVVSRRLGPRWLVVPLVAGCLAVAPAQVALYSWNHQQLGVAADRGAANDLSDLRAATSTYQGSVLQLGSIKSVDPGSGAVRSGRIIFGHQGAAAGIETLGRYTGIDFPAYTTPLCMDYRGGTECTDLAPRLLEPVDERYPVPLVDALGVDTLVYSKASFELSEILAPPGWEKVLEDQDRVAFVRPDPPRGLVVSTTDGVTVEDAVDVDGTVHLTLDAAAEGSVLLNRLAWPGYEVTDAAGRQVATDQGPYGLLELRTAEGVSDLTISFRSPGLTAGAAIAGAGLVVALVLSVLHTRARSRRRSGASDETRVRTSREPYAETASSSSTM